MKIVITKEDGTEEVIQNVLDYCLTLRQKEPVADGQIMGFEIKTYTLSTTTGGLRDICKEVRQTLFELQGYLDGNDS